ncbi:FAD-dependent oxidoreductase, partial [Streptomyces galilaeus]
KTSAGLITAKVFIDASYEGDLMAGAVGTANYVVGREAKSVYNEPTAGFLAGRTAPYADALPGPKPLGYPLIADPALA